MGHPPTPRQGLGQPCPGVRTASCNRNAVSLYRGGGLRHVRDARALAVPRPAAPLLGAGGHPPLQLRAGSRRASGGGGVAAAAQQAAAAAAATESAAPQAGAVVGVVVVDHGSRRAESNDMLVQFVELYRQVTGRGIVEVAHMELADPTIEQAVARCVQQGATKVVVAPYFLSKGRHIQQDIPALVAAARKQLPPGVSCVIAEPIGIDTLMAQLVESRVQAAEARDS